MQNYALLPNQTVGFATSPMATGGYTWTLPSVLGEFLQIAQSRYGPRDRDFTILGIEFGQQGPKIWFPGHRKDIVIQLGQLAQLEPSRALFQLAHEAIHILAPISPPALVVEEGLAVVFSDEIGAVQVQPFFTNGANYIAAGHLVRQLLALDPMAIRKIRDQVPRFSDWTPNLVTDVIPTADHTLADALCSPFQY